MQLHENKNHKKDKKKSRKISQWTCSIKPSDKLRFCGTNTKGGNRQHNQLCIMQQTKMT